MLAIASGKGGCGKTTTTLGLATALAAERRAVQAVDLDVDMPDLHVLAGVDRPPKVPPDDPAVDRCRRAPGRPGVYVVPAPTADCARPVDRILETLPPRPTLLDAPAGAGEDLARSLAVADQCLLVTTDRPEAIEDSLKTATIARELGTGVAGVAVRTDREVPTSLADRFDVDPGAVVRIPSVVDDPLANPEVRSAYRQIASILHKKGYVSAGPTTTET